MRRVTVVVSMFGLLLALAPACKDTPVEGEEPSECWDGLDNDGDGAIDCLDAGCMSHPLCAGDTGERIVLTIEENASIDTVPVFINEFMAGNNGALLDEHGDADDWIEVHNRTDEDIDLGGYTITDDLGERGKHTIEAGVIVPADGFLVLWADDEEESEGPTHLDFKLDKGGEELGLYYPNTLPLTSLSFGPQHDDVSAAREYDGASTWVFDETGTPGETNGSP